jgi:lipoyl(octanoyl) transferase
MSSPPQRPVDEIIVRTLGRVDYPESFRAMQQFTDTRTEATCDELWLVEHPPVFTMGLKGRDGKVTRIRDIPLVYTDRGGDMTYHGPGQLVAYILMDLTRRGWGAKRLVQAMEQAVIELLASHQIHGQRRAGAPGIYVVDSKIASLGLRVRRGASYHGIALNINMDLTPFSYIDPCGYPGQPVTQLVDLGIRADMPAIGQAFAEHLCRALGYTAPYHTPDLTAIPPRAMPHG